LVTHAAIKNVGSIASGGKETLNLPVDALGAPDRRDALGEHVHAFLGWLAAKKELPEYVE
jgi:hypothetical protein